MTDMPWQADACSLVEAFRSGERSPVEELEASLAAIDDSDLNCFSHLEPERAQQAAKEADVSLPFGGVPVAIKQLESVAGWPFTHGSLVFADHVATRTSHAMERLLGQGGAVPVGLTTSSEFGGLNVSTTKLTGVTHNPWRHGRTVGGSSGGSAAAVSGGLVTLATGGDGGGSIRIPAGYCGLLGMKGTFGRIPRSPGAFTRPNTVVLGNLARSVRDAARYYDVCAGPHAADPSSLPPAGPWEASLGTHDLRGLKVGVLADLGRVKLEKGVADHTRAHADALIAATGMVEVDITLDLPVLTAHWMIDNMSTLIAEMGKKWPGCEADMTDEIAIGAHLAQSLYNIHTAAAAQHLYIRANEALADAFDKVDLIICATNPGPAFPAESAMSTDNRFVEFLMTNAGMRFLFRQAMFATRLGGAAFPKLPSALLTIGSRLLPGILDMGALTMISNLYGNPAVSIPAGTMDGLPVGMQVLGRHHSDALLLDVALSVERERPWPLVAPGV